MSPAKRLLTLALTVAAGGGAIAAVAVAPATAGSTATTPTIKLMNFPGHPKILSVGGFVVYRFTHDGTGHRNTCVTMHNGCSAAWPALTTVGKPHAGPGVNPALLGTIRIGRKHQVTYAGHPIYRYAFGSRGSTSYVNFPAFGGRWPGVNAKGGVVK